MEWVAVVAPGWGDKAAIIGKHQVWRELRTLHLPLEESDLIWFLLPFGVSIMTSTRAARLAIL
jgi:hypothetical protein